MRQLNKILLCIYLFSFTLVANSQTADFTFQSSNGLYCNPATIQFTQITTGNPSGFVWSFGNGVTSNNPNPVFTYGNPGTYSIKLIAIYDQFALEVKKTIVINPFISVSIGYNRNYICTPGTINFNAVTGGNIAAYNWDFGDGSGNISTTVSNITHNFLNFGIYTVTVKATDVSGCFAKSNPANITVTVPSITGTLSPTSGCVPANVTFNANVLIPINSSVTNYAWNFKDGSPVFSTTSNNTNHIYNTAGGYSPSVMITTSEGCTNNFTFDSIAFGTPPVNHVAYPLKTVICGSENASFFSKATNANSYYWDFGDGRFAKVYDSLTRHKFYRLGTKNISVTPAFNECNGIPILFQINVIGVIASFDYTNTCGDKKTFLFTNTSQGNQSTVSWDFGDGSPVVNTVNAVHTFPASGSFVTTLTVTDNITGCSDTYPETIYTADPALVNPDTAICKNSNTTFSISNNYGNPSAAYTWNVLGIRAGPLNAFNFMTNGSVLGYFNSNSVIINNGPQYCPDSISLNHTILVRGPIIDFTAPDVICFNSRYNVSNLSKPFVPADSITVWNWNFGENNIADTNYQPGYYIYNNPGVFNVKLIGIDKNGCKDSLVKIVTVNPTPFLQVIPGIDTLCSGRPDTLIAFHNDPIFWSASNLVSCATCDTVFVNPPSTTKFYVTATNPLGCNSTDSVLVKVYKPFVATSPASDFYICLNDRVKLDIDPPGKKIIWSPPARLSTTNNYGAVASPLQTTQYTATLTDSVGCFTSSTSVTVHVKSLAVVIAGPDKIYPYNGNFSIAPLYSNNISAYSWTPSTLLTCNNCAFPNGTATNTTTYFIKVTSDSGCVATDTITIFVDCKNAYILMPTAFTPNNDNTNDTYYPLTRGIRSISRFSIYNRDGKLVYEAKTFPPNNNSFGWTGKISGKGQSTSVFVYYIEALCDTGEKLYRKGSVLLIK